MYKFIEDPAHAWLGVPVAELEELAIADTISKYSYIDKAAGIAWLEEDCDLAKFLAAKIGPVEFAPAAWGAWMKANTKTNYCKGSASVRKLPAYSFDAFSACFDDDDEPAGCTPGCGGFMGNC